MTSQRFVKNGIDEQCNRIRLADIRIIHELRHIISLPIEQNIPKEIMGRLCYVHLIAHPTKIDICIIISILGSIYVLTIHNFRLSIASVLGRFLSSLVNRALID